MKIAVRHARLLLHGLGQQDRCLLATLLEQHSGREILCPITEPTIHSVPQPGLTRLHRSGGVIPTARAHQLFRPSQVEPRKDVIVPFAAGPDGGRLERLIGALRGACQAIERGQSESLVDRANVFVVERRVAGLGQQPVCRGRVARLHGQAALFQQRYAGEWMVEPAGHAFGPAKTFQGQIGFALPEVGHTQLQVDPGIGPMIGWCGPSRQDAHQGPRRGVVEGQRAQELVAAANRQGGCADDFDHVDPPVLQILHNSAALQCPFGATPFAL